jgi:hypothetical protein
MMLADTSVWSWARRNRLVHDELRALADDGRLATCGPVMLELLYSARNPREYADARADLAALPQCPINQPEWDRAFHVYDALAAQGALHQRQVSHPDLLIAAAAESAGIPVLHYDEDYDRIEAITGQAMQWVRPRGSLG